MVSEHIRQELRRPWAVVFLDGRNEHGSHVLPMQGANLPWDEVEPMLPENAERILAEAEAAGHSVGADCVVTMWRWVRDIDEVVGGWWEYDGYHADLTAILCGTPYEQRNARPEIEHELT